MVRKNKKGVELSINFVVMLVLAIAVFSLGLVFVSKLFTKAEEIKFNLDKQSEMELKSILSGGTQVAIYPSRFDVKKGHTQLVAIGVLNTLKEPPGIDNEFKIDVKFEKAFDYNNLIFCEQSSGSGCAGGDVDKWLITESMRDSYIGVSTQIKIPKNSQSEFLVVAKVPSDAAAGTYIFSVLFQYNSDGFGNFVEYRRPERFYIIVK